MSYRGLGQYPKVVPGMVYPSILPPGQTKLFSYEELRRRGLPIAPYIEKGSYVTGQPDIYRYGLDPYRGIMGQAEPSLPPLSQAFRSSMGVGVISGLIGGLLGRPILGAAVGGLVGWFFRPRF